MDWKKRADQLKVEQGTEADRQRTLSFVERLAAAYLAVGEVDKAAEARAHAERLRS